MGREWGYQMDGLFEGRAWIINIALPAIQTAACGSAGVAIARGSMCLFWAFVALALVSLFGTYFFVRREAIAYRVQDEANATSSVAAHYRTERGKGRLLMPIVAWIVALLIWVFLLPFTG